MLAYCGKSHVTHDGALKNKTSKSVCVRLQDCAPGTITLDVLEAKGKLMTTGADCSTSPARRQVRKKDLTVIAPGKEVDIFAVTQPFYESADRRTGIWKPMPANRSYTARIRLPVLLDCDAAFAACGPQGCEWSALEASGKVHLVEMTRLKGFDLGSEDCPAE